MYKLNSSKQVPNRLERQSNATFPRLPLFVIGTIFALKDHYEATAMKIG